MCGNGQRAGKNVLSGVRTGRTQGGNNTGRGHCQVGWHWGKEVGWGGGRWVGEGGRGCMGKKGEGGWEPALA